MIAKLLNQFRKDESGAAMVEYAIALLVAAGIGIGAFSLMGTNAGLNAEAACNVLNGEAADGCAPPGGG